MNLDSKLEQIRHKLKQKKSTEQGGEKSDRLSSRLFAPSSLVLIGLFLVLAAVSALAVRDFLVWNKLPQEMIGLWEVGEGSMKGGTFEFMPNGTMEVQVYNKKKHITHKTRVVVRDKTLFITARDPLALQAVTSESIIRELTADTLILELEKGEVLKMVRVD
jgi:hypothetical protein